MFLDHVAHFLRWDAPTLPFLIMDESAIVAPLATFDPMKELARERLCCGAILKDLSSKLNPRPKLLGRVTLEHLVIWSVRIVVGQLLS